MSRVVVEELDETIEVEVRRAVGEEELDWAVDDERLVEVVQEEDDETALQSP